MNEASGLSGAVRARLVHRGLQPRLLLWIYTMVMRPVLTFGSMIWWRRIRCNISRLELSKLRRLVWINVTGMMKTTSRAAVEVLLHFLLCVWWFRWRPRQGSTDSYATNSGDLNPLPIVMLNILGHRAWTHSTSGTDKIILRYAYHKSFRVKFPNKYEWQYIFNPDHKGGRSGIQTAPRPMKALVPGCIIGAWKVLASTPHYCRRKYTPLRHA